MAFVGSSLCIVSLLHSVLTASYVPVTKNESVKYFTAFELDL